MRFLYVAATWVAFVLLVPFLAVMRKTRDGFFERLGFYRKDLFPSDGTLRVWLHGASAGDLLALLPMIQLLRAAVPDVRIFVSTMTNTGRLMAAQKLAETVDAVFFVPWDLLGATRRAARAVRPHLLVLEYTEIWPNLIRAVRQSGAKIAMTNGRFSERNLEKYRIFFEAIGNPLHDIDLFLMREQSEAERVHRLGAPVGRIRVTGNTKFDALMAKDAAGDLQQLGRDLGVGASSRLWIAGSTHDGEEEGLIRIFKRLLHQEASDLRLLIAPRYVDRVSSLLDLVQSAGLRGAVRSSPLAVDAQVIILDTIGELATLYRLATVVFVGGSFTKRGGQNILEPAAQGRPVLFGPHMENFHDSVQILVGRGGIQVNDFDHLESVLVDLLSRPDSLVAVGALARESVTSATGASQRNVDALLGLVRK